MDNNLTTVTMTTTGSPKAHQWNITEPKMDTNFAILLCSLLFAILWVTYIVYYNSRLIGYIMTKIINELFIKEGYFKIGSFAVNALSGKIMFRDVVYITHDYTIRVQDGYLIFRWWRSYVPKDVSEDLSHSDTRLSVVLNGFELHVYNRSELYSSLEKTFGLKPTIFTDTGQTNVNEILNVENAERSETVDGKISNIRKQRSEAAMARTWRDLIPVIKMDISSCRLVFGNKLVPTTLSITAEESHFVYSTKPAVCTLDSFMHFVKCKAENVRVMLAPSPKYTGMLDEPPRYMGEGFVLMSSNATELYFYMDEPGLVRDEPVLITLTNGDVVESSPPQWGVDIKCGKGTDFSYGPWADRQREHLFKFFYPQDYEPMTVTPVPKPGEKRQMESFDIRLSMQDKATVDILFSKNKETNAVHININAGSYLEITVPWVTLENGYTTKINGQLLLLEATTSLQYRDLVSSETLEFSIACHYPVVWNEHQLWELNMTGCKATVHLIFYHKWFFQDLINDWATKQRPDILHFVPYTWRFGLTLKHCELLTLVNQYNWIDCSSVGKRQKLENTQIALCAHFLHLSFDLPFDEFLPETLPINFSIQGESIDLSLFIPEYHTSRNIVLLLEKFAKIRSKDGSASTKKNEIIPKWRQVCQASNGWVDFWWVPIGAINILYIYHPCPPLGPAPQADVSTPVKEAIMLSPMRFPLHRKSHRSPDGVKKFDPTTLKADTVAVELEIGPSVLLLYGTALRNFLNFKENIFGDDQKFTDMQQSSGTVSISDAEAKRNDDDSYVNLQTELQEDFDQRNYRPLEVDVSIIMHDVQAHLLKNCTEKDPPCPVILVERFGFEMKKRYDQTELQLLLSPSILLVSDNVIRPSKDKHLSQGRLTLSSLQIRGHAMFSDVDRSLDEDTIEYAWLVELQCGKLSGKLTASQLHSLVVSLETLLLLVCDSENELISPKDDVVLGQPPIIPSTSNPFQNVQQALQSLLQKNPSSTSNKSTVNNNNNSNSLPKNVQQKPKEKKVRSDKAKPNNPNTAVVDLNACNPHKLKYKFVRVAVDAIDFWLVESGAALQLWMSPIRLASCNLHGKQVGSGLSSVIYSASLRQTVWQPQKYNHSKTNSESDVWLEVGVVNFGPLIIEAAMSTNNEKESNMHALQQRFLRLHDDKLKKLWFLWPESTKSIGKCGCTGGCAFFGSNRNGTKFFKPSKKDFDEGINVAAFRVNETGKDPGYGQSILHDDMLVFRTPPYIVNEISLQDTLGSLKRRKNAVKLAERIDCDAQNLNNTSPNSLNERKVNRRYSSTSIRSSILKDVPYSRLMDTCHVILPAKLDSDSKLHTDKPKVAVIVPDSELLPKSSASDSKLAVDYFNSPLNLEAQQRNTPHRDISMSPIPVARSVNASESHHSLKTKISGCADDATEQVQRTISMSSENHSEAFFSADEDFNSINSRSSSLRNSILSSNATLTRQDSGGPPRKKYSSELSIVTDSNSNASPQVHNRTLTATALESVVKHGLSTHRSDHEIHTPEHRIFFEESGKHLDDGHRTIHGLATPHRCYPLSARSVSPRLPLKMHVNASPGVASMTADTVLLNDLDSSDSYSSTSYVSAVGSQEDFTLVDLHMQVNRQIVDSPMLMSSYVSHLNQVKCHNWSTTLANTCESYSVPLFQKNDEDNKLIYIGGRFVPIMESLSEGVTSMKMVSRQEHAGPSSSGKTPTGGGSSTVYNWDAEDCSQTGQQQQHKNDDNDTSEFTLEEELLCNQADAGSRTALIVKFKGDIDVTVTPLLLETLQRYVDVLTPAVANLHPMTVINHFHSSCIGQVESANILKTTENVKMLSQGGHDEDGNVTETRVHQEIIKNQLQAAVFLPKVNITLLQVSIVEEIISFSALDNIKDLTCVSLFSVCFDNVVLKYHSDRQIREVLQKFYRPSVVQSGSKKGANKARHFLGLHTTTNADIIRGEPVYIESCDGQTQQLVVCLGVGKVHAQLRRLRNESSILNDAVITAIPGYCSKVLFTSTKMRPIHRGIDYYMQPSVTETPITTNSEESTIDDKLGFIMFECGLEGISLKVIKKSQYEQADSREVIEKKSATTNTAETSQTEATEEEIKTDSNNKQTAGSRTSEPVSSVKSNRKTIVVDVAVPPKSATVEGVTTDDRASKTEDEIKECVPVVKDTKNVSSCVIEIKMVWFNFAAPPRTPITRKIDYTRLDWNLLSTASPAINAWMNPSNRLAIRIVHMVRSMYRRSTAIVACLMSEALDMQGIHIQTKSRYDKMTPLAKTVKDDPSCQLCTVLQKFYLQSDPAVIESNLRENDLPQLFTLRQGVIVLSRQWKNILYTPLMSQNNNVRSKVKPVNVTISIADQVNGLQHRHHHQLQDIHLTDGEASGNDEPDITDEHVRLLHSGIILKPNAHHHPHHQRHIGLTTTAASSTGKETCAKIAGSGYEAETSLLSPQVAVVSVGLESVLTSPSPPVSNKRRKKSLQPSQLPSSSRASVVLPLLTSTNNPFAQRKQQTDDISYGMLKEDKTVVNLGSDQSVCTHSSPELPCSPMHRAAGHARSSEDLYSWMAKQDENEPALRGYMESKINTLQTDSSGEEILIKDNQHETVSFSYPIPDSLRLLDANLIFQPLLSSLGVMPQQLKLAAITESNSGNDVTSLDALGSNLSLVGNMETMRIDIVVSEHGKMMMAEKKKGKTKNNKTARSLHIDITSDESPAFVCEKVSIDLEVDRVTDMAVHDIVKTKSSLYISRGQLKNHTSTVINFNVGVRYISQRVNMPLLRLLHQISNMYQNVKDTQNELREQHPADIRRPKTSASDHADIKHSTSTSDMQDTLERGNKPLSLKISDPGSILSQHHKPTVASPSPSIRSRPQSFAQKLRSTGKSAKGYVNLSEVNCTTAGAGGAATPITLSSPSGSALERITVSSDKSAMVSGRCWKTIYHLLDLYANMPDTKTIKHRFSVGTADISEHYKGNRKYDILTEVQSTEDLEKNDDGSGPHQCTPPPTQPPLQQAQKETRIHGVASASNENTKLVVFGVARIYKTRLLATLSGLKLEAEITNLHSSLTCKKKYVPISLECSLTGQIGRTMIVLLEGVAPNQQTVVKVTVGKSQALYSSFSKRSKDKNSGLLTVGAVNIDIPQHPVALHGMVTRGSKQLSSTLQELRVTRTSSRLSKGQQFDDDQVPVNSPGTNLMRRKNNNNNGVPFVSSNLQRSHLQEQGLLQPLVMQFSVILQSLSISAALLPSLQAQYKMDQVTSTGVTGKKAKFTIDLPHHSLSFTTKLQVTEANLPSEASIALPAVHVAAEYIPEGTPTLKNDGHRGQEGLVFMQGGYLSAQAEIGVFEHSLTTDLLNHLVFVQKVFMKEVNEVVQKVYGGERPVPIWLEDTEDSSSINRILFSLVIQMQRIQLTATTAGSSAVRLETGAVVLELSNRVQNVSGSTQSNATSRLFGKAHVDLNLSLGQLIRNALFEEAEAEFQQFAFFNTRIGLRNAFQDEIVEGEDKEVVLITLKRPLIYIQPVAVDKAILVWLNYKNAYDYWNEKRANLNKEVLTATQQVYEKFQLGQITSQLGAQHLGTLFLQLTVEDMGICLPLNPLPLTSWGQRNVYEESRGAVVVTLENTSISACSSGSLVSKGKFSNLCLRFADDFETSLDDWKPDMTDSAIMNLCVVSDGTYEVCSRTIAAKQPNENAKWFLNVQWQMEGVDIHLDVNVGKQLSALGHTLTMLTGAEDAQFPVDYDSDDNEPTDGTKASQESILPAFVFDPTLDNKKRSKLIEKEMNEQAKIINDLRSLGASHGTIELELKRLHELEAMVYKDFRRDMIQKFRRQSVKASTLKGKLGLGYKSSTYRSRSFIVPSSMPENQGSPDEVQGPVTSNSGSYESSPRSGPSRSASLRVRNVDGGPHVTFSDAQHIGRQSSLPSASSELSLPDTQIIDWNDHIDIDGEKVEMRKKAQSPFESLADSFISDPPLTSSPLQPSNLQQQQPSSTSMLSQQQEPNIDLELDVKVFINSGKCVLHTKDIVREEEVKLNRARKDRSSSAGLLEFPAPIGSPDFARRNKEKHGGQSSASRLRNAAHATTLVDLTIFHIPGMDVKLQYQSKVLPEDFVESEQETPANFTNDFAKSTNSFAHSEEMRIDEAFKIKNFTHTDPISIPTATADGSDTIKQPTQGISNPNYKPSSSSSSSSNSSSSSDDNVDVYQTNAASFHNVHKSDTSIVVTSKKGIKKAALFVWMTLQSVPEETIISPHILEFLEQTLEPIPAKTHFNAATGSTDQENTNYGNYVYASFPVDVIVYFHMQPSTFRFSCLPVSRVECMLQLPSLDIVFSSKRAEDELIHSEFGDGTPNIAATAVGGLSVTGCLSDFSVYIFHPYGGKKSSLKEAQWSPLSDSERKDSLSIYVEFVKFHLSRSRMLNFKQDATGKPCGGIGGGVRCPEGSRAVIRFSTITDIGSASFKYDMRRLTEILAFPKAWYRRSIVRRMFLGDLSMTAPYNDEDGVVADVSPSGTTRSSGVAVDARTSRNNEWSPLLNTREKLRLTRSRDVDRYGDGDHRLMAPSPEHKSLSSTWETLVLFAVNFKRLNVHMNMGNVMGNVSWLTKEFRSEGRLSIGSTGHKNLYIAVGLGGSGLDAKGGIVGGNIEIANIDTYVHIREEPDVEPDHTVGLRLRALELRLDYMATSVLMCRVSDLNVKLRDEWRLNRSAGSSAFMPTRRPASIFMHGDLSWDQLQIMMSKSSTVDLLKMYNKLEEFFSQQFNSSKRAFSNFSQSNGRHLRLSTQKGWSNQQQQQQQQKPEQQQQQQQHVPNQITASDAKHHRHWQKVLAQVAGLKLNTMDVPLPSYGTVLGGTMELHGNNISLACFHGLNFKNKSWALFSLREPSIHFNTEAQEITSTTEPAPAQDVHVVQTLTCSLGSSTFKTHHSMATVCKVSRSVIFPPQFKTLQEWFHYAFANSQIDEVDKFPSLERERDGQSTSSMERTRSSSSSGNNAPKFIDPNHNREVIFALPSLQLHLKTEHLQAASVPDLDSDKPIVECSFITEFEDHIFVTVDAEAFFFLHDLITSYLKEKEKLGSTLTADKRSCNGGDSSTDNKSRHPALEQTQKKSIDVDIFAKDWRDYNCKTWHLEPTVRLLSVAGKYIEPYGIDYILQKLGFSHARTTIPKWMQRGFMDPLDAILAVLTLHMVQVIKGDGSGRTEKERIEYKK